VVPGGTANIHFNIAPLQTCMGITDTSRKRAENGLLCIAHSNLDRQELNPCTSLSNICT
jgi:hypothetical protein